jgi:hypothetical protein
LFIDFKRERTEEETQDGNLRIFYRGSLFSHQELAIASFLEIEAVGFQQRGMRHEGMLGVVQLNCEAFDFPSDLPDLVLRKIKELGWKSGWKAQLLTRRESTESSDEPKRRIYHIEVVNQHRRKPAMGCAAFLQEVRPVEGEPIPFLKFELKWAGTTVPHVTIMPQEARSFDAFYITETEPTRLQWKDFSYTDNPDVCPNVRTPGTYELTYVVTSLNFPMVFAKFVLKLNDRWEDLSTLELQSHESRYVYDPYAL